MVQQKDGLDTPAHGDPAMSMGLTALKGSAPMGRRRKSVGEVNIHLVQGTSAAQGRKHRVAQHRQVARGLGER